MAPVLPIIMGLAQFAPHLMRFFGAGETSTAVADKVADVAMAVSGAKTPAEALATIRANAEMQAQFAQRTLELDHEMERAYLADVADARKRDVAIRQSGQRNTRADVMVAIDALGLVACLVVLAFFRESIPSEVVALLSTIASIFGLCLRDAHQFEFGSSRGSKQKDAAMADMANKR